MVEPVVELAGAEGRFAAPGEQPFEVAKFLTDKGLRHALSVA
jgi:hypothetical protein